jgi:phosphoribosylformylglycinamidine cyclo-ligase
VESIEMFNTFNMGVGFVLVVPSAEAEQALQLLPQAFDIGEVVAGDGQVLGLVEWD